MERPINASKNLDHGGQTDHGTQEEEQTEESTLASISNLEKAKQNAPRAKDGSQNFVDMLLNKVRERQGMKVAQKPKPQLKAASLVKKPLGSSVGKSWDIGQHYDSSDDLLGFPEEEIMPGIRNTPAASYSKTRGNPAFESETLDEYMRENSLGSTDNKTVGKSSTYKQRKRHIDGLVEIDCVPPYMEMPVVPESLRKWRTVAERRQYLRKCSKNQKLPIITNEATIFRELQRKIRNPRLYSVSQQMLQAPHSSMSFTRQGWQAASFVATEFNHYYHQILDVDNGEECVRLPGVRGNNQERSKRPYKSRVLPSLIQNCGNNCIDALIWRDLKPFRSLLPIVVKPCLLSRKPFDEHLDDETAPMLLPDSTMSMVPMPSVELEVFPAKREPLHEVAKYYLQYIMPYEVISREWAEFSVSTLQQSVSSKNDKPSSESNSPYLNYRSNALRRRIANQCEELDESFKMAKYSERDLLENFSFRENLHKSDDVLMECADVVSNLINSVAISCSENSFIKEDPNELCAKNNLETEQTVPNKSDYGKVNPLTPAVKSNKKQTRLLMELRRLNATIVDIGEQANKEVQPCSKDFCRFGCVCASLSDSYPIRKHCGKAECVTECICGGSNQSPVICLENDGRSISTEDALMLRQKATERLARMEKEFTSTVVLAGNQTLLINESQYDRKRRCTKAPKRYKDFVEKDDNASRITENTSPNGSCSETPAELRKPILVQENILAQLKHCTVALVRLQDTSNMAIWCMFHELYNCPCRGHALEGRPLAIERETNTTSTHPNVSSESDDDYLIMPKKARYSFEEIEEAEEGKNRTVKKWVECNPDDETSLNSGDDRNPGFPNHPPAKKSKISKSKQKHERPVECYADDENSLNSSDDANSGFPKKYHPAKKLQTSKSKQKPGRPAFASYLEKYFNERPTACRRVVPLPHNIYKRINCKRRAQTLELIKRSESEETQLMLNEHVMRSVYFYRHQVENREDEIQTNGVNVEAEAKLDVKAQENHERKPSERKSIKELKQGSRDISGDVNLLGDIDLTSTIDPQQDALKTATIDAIATTNTTVATTTAVATTTTPAAATKTAAATLKNILAPIIPTNRPSNQQPIASSLISETTLTGVALPDSHRLGREVVNNLNRLVHMKIRDIGNALKRKTNVIPPTRDNILCIIAWRNFLDAFVKRNVFLWQVHTTNKSCFLVATIQEVMPQVNDAVAVMNITTLKINEMPKLARLLKQKYEKSRNLAVAMRGHPNYWRVLGFLRRDEKRACQNPTPRTHPSLAKKVNFLAGLLTHQHAQSFTKVLKPFQENQQQQDQPARSPQQQLPCTQQELQSTDIQSKPRSPQQQLPSTEEELQPINIESNIKFRKVTMKDLDEIQEIIICENNHRWFVLDVYWDFSHILIPEICEIIELERIQKLLSFSQEKGKIVKLQLFRNAPFDAFVTPKSKNKLYFGPLKVESELPILILLQSVNKKHMLREVYQTIHNVRPHPIERTTAFCILFIDGQFQAENLTDKDIPRRQLLPKHFQELEDSDDSDDDDCIIVDVTTGEPEKAQTENGDSIRVEPLKKPQTENGASIRVKPLEKLQEGSSQNQCQFTKSLQTVTDYHRLQIVQGDNCAQPTVSAIDEQHQDGTLHNHQNLTTFSIQTIVNSSQLTIMQIDNNSQPIDQQLQVQNGPIFYIPLSTPLPYATTEQQVASQFGLVPLLNLPANTIITSVPQQMPIYISSMPVQSNTPNIPSISNVNMVNVQPTVSDPMVASKSTEVTFLTPDDCVTSTAEVTGDRSITLTPATNSVVVTEKLNTPTLMSVANPIWKLPLSNVQSVAAQTDEVAENSNISKEQHNSLTDGQTKGKKVSLIRDVLNRSTGVLPKVNIKTADPQAITQQPKNIASVAPNLAVLSPKTYLKTALHNAAARHIAYSAKNLPTNSQTNKCLNVVSKNVQTENIVSPKGNLPKSEENSKTLKATDINSEKMVKPLKDTVTSIEDIQAGMTLPKISEIGSTIKYTDPSNMTFTLEGNALEPDASVVFRRPSSLLNGGKGDSKNRSLKPLNSSLPPYQRTANSVCKATTTTTSAATKLPTKSMNTAGEKISYKSGVLVKGLAGNSSKIVVEKRPFNVVTSTSTTTTRTMTTSTPITTVACSKPKTTIGTQLSKPTVKTANVAVVAPNSKQRLLVQATPTNSGTTVNTTPKTTVSAVKINPFNTLQHKKTCVITTVNSNSANNASSAANGKNNLQHKISSPSTVTGSNVTPVISSNGIYGILCSNHPDVQKFQGKRFSNFFMVKVPNVGILRRRTMEEVSSYLNQHVLKLNPTLKLTKKLTWKFFPKHIFPNNALTSNKSVDVPMSKEQQQLNILPTLKTSAVTRDMSDGIEETDTVELPPLEMECEDPILIDD